MEMEDCHCKKHDVLYGKFLPKSRVYFQKWLPVFANYRRDGYDFDALFEDEKAPIKHKNIMDHFMENDAEIYSYELKNWLDLEKMAKRDLTEPLPAL